jgi:ribosomal protein L11 methyltransferase
MSCLQISVLVGSGDADHAGSLLEQLGAFAVTLSGTEGGGEVLEPMPGEQPLWERAQLAALFDLNVDIGGLKAELERHRISIEDLAFVPDEDWQNRWRMHAVTACFGQRLWLLPRQAAAEFAPDPHPGWDLERNDVATLRLDPGLAFGTGSHPTTRLCLSWLATADLTGSRVLDFGCGSGVLALAACLLGAAQVTAVDHDPQALVATQDNAAYNKIPAEQLTVITPALLAERSARGEVFDVVIANILANPLIELAGYLSAMTAEAGELVLSGLLRDQEQMIRDAYPAFQFHSVALEGDWIRLHGRRADTTRRGPDSG